LRFLAENSILLITATSFTQHNIIFTKILTFRFNWQFSFSPNGGRHEPDEQFLNISKLGQDALILVEK